MSRTITYTLKPSSPISDEYYQVISAFAQRSIDIIKLRHSTLVSGFREYLGQTMLSDRSDAEVSFELLSLSVYLREYKDEAHRMPAWANSLLKFLISSRTRWTALEALFKKLSGWMNGVSRLAPGKRGENNEFLELISWLKACGENIKAERFKPWIDFSLNSHEFPAQVLSRICLGVADEFDRESLEVLGKYTGMVDHFLSTGAAEHRWKYDAPLVSKTRLEYHLGMVGTEILNNVFRERFRLTERKVVILPPCMSAPQLKCQARQTALGAKCNSCTPSCRVNQITKLGEKHGFEVYMIPDDVKIFSSANGVGRIGVVGVSCALTNWNGGWETGSLDIPAQGVLLDYVGCKYHWDRNGIPTDTNLRKLLDVLGIATKA